MVLTGEPEPGVDTGATFVDLDLGLGTLAVDWFDMPFDCFWFNPAPNRGSFDPVVQDDPVLELDSIDGEGSERASLDQPEDGLIYRIGVHVERQRPGSDPGDRVDPHRRPAPL